MSDCRPQVAEVVGGALGALETFAWAERIGARIIVRCAAFGAGAHSPASSAEQTRKPFSSCIPNGAVYRDHTSHAVDAPMIRPMMIAVISMVPSRGLQAACLGRYVAMKCLILASVSGQRRRGLERALSPRNSLISRQSPSASRPNALSAIPWVAMNASISFRSVLCMG